MVKRGEFVDFAIRLGIESDTKIATELAAGVKHPAGLSTELSIIVELAEQIIALKKRIEALEKPI